jgi:hypothetical protein
MTEHEIAEDPAQRERESREEPDTKFHQLQEQEEAERLEQARKIGAPLEPRDDED